MTTKQTDEQIICEWISSLKSKKATSITLIDVRRLVNELSKKSTGLVAYKIGFVRELSRDEVVRLAKLLISPGEVTLPSGERVSELNRCID